MAVHRQGAARASPFVAMLVAVGCLCASWATAPAEIYSEAAVKAAFIHRFSGYVEWPREAAPTTRLTIGVMGDPDVAGLLETLVARQAATARPTQVVRIARIADLGDAQILYIGAGARRDLRKTIAAVETKPVLVVTDDENGMDMGATVNFLVVDRRVRFEVSLTAAQRAGLKISSDLLSVAARVIGGLRTDATCARQPPGGQGDENCATRIADAAQ